MKAIKKMMKKKTTRRCRLKRERKIIKKYEDRKKKCQEKRERKESREVTHNKVRFPLTVCPCLNRYIKSILSTRKETQSD